MDNRIFNVNGRLDRGGERLLLKTLELALAIQGSKVSSWQSTPESGLILEWYASSNSVKLPSPMTAEGIFPMVLAWLSSAGAKATKLEDWDRDYDHDGSNGPGWRVYCEDWGHVGSAAGAIVAVKPAFMWYGK